MSWTVLAGLWITDSGRTPPRRLTGRGKASRAPTAGSTRGSWLRPGATASRCARRRPATLRPGGALERPRPDPPLAVARPACWARLPANPGSERMGHGGIHGPGRRFGDAQATVNGRSADRYDSTAQAILAGAAGLTTLAAGPGSTTSRSTASLGGRRRSGRRRPDQAPTRVFRMRAPTPVCRMPAPTPVCRTGNDAVFPTGKRRPACPTRGRRGRSRRRHASALRRPGRAFSATSPHDSTGLGAKWTIAAGITSPNSRANAT